MVSENALCFDSGSFSSFLGGDCVSEDDDMFIRLVSSGSIKEVDEDEEASALFEESDFFSSVSLVEEEVADEADVLKNDGISVALPLPPVMSVLPGDFFCA